jgi:hypothetical protein
MPAEFVKGIAEPVVTYAVRERPIGPPLHRLRKQETDDGLAG